MLEKIDFSKDKLLNQIPEYNLQSIVNKTRITERITERMTQLIKKEKSTSYYNLIISFTTLDSCYETIIYKYDKTEVEKYNTEFIDLIKFIFVYHYSSPASNGAIGGFNHIEDVCYFLNYCTDQCEDNNNITCKYFNNDDGDDDDDGHQTSKFALDIPINPYGYYDCYYRISSLKIELVDEDSKIYDIAINFNDGDINDIVNRIKKAHTINYGYVYSKLCDWEPKIFLETYETIINEQDEAEY